MPPKTIKIRGIPKKKAGRSYILESTSALASTPNSSFYF
jgi:hypothetical protein